MSGFVGILNTDGAPVDRALLSRLTGSLALPRSDSPNVWLDGNIGLGHVGFPARDLSTNEMQPLSLDGSAWIVGDARIDARADLISLLNSCGEPTTGDASDGELILRSYRVWGENCVLHLTGDFSFAVWDKPRRSLFAARDHFGVKPLYYANLDRHFLFGNQLNFLCLHPSVSAALDESSIADYLLFHFVQDQTASRLSNIRRLAPGSSLRYCDGALRVSRYWALPVESPISYERPTDYVERFITLFDTAVSDRLRGPSASIFMSGGLDSTSVAASAHRRLSKQDGPFDLAAYTQVLSRIIPHDEREYADMVAGQYRIPIRYVVEDDPAIFAQLADAFPEVQVSPVGHPLRAALLLLRWLAAEHSPVALSGFGGDPVLYPTQLPIYSRFARQGPGQLVRDVGYYVRQTHRLPNLYLRTALKTRLSGKRAFQPHLPDWYDAGFAARVGLADRWGLGITEPDLHPYRPQAYSNTFSPVWSQVFESADPGATRIPLEVRYPFFDLRLVNFLFRVPPVPWFDDKHILREAMRERLPERVRTRIKTPLRGDPLWELVRARRVPEMDRLSSVHGFDRFVNISKVRVEAPNCSHEQALFLGPILNLAEWLWQQNNLKTRRFTNTY